MFTDRLKLSLSLTVGSDSFELPAGAVREVRLRAMPWGFDASATFLVSCEDDDDAIFPRFVTRDLAKAKVVMERVREDGDKTRAFSLSGVVTEKHMEEVAGVDEAGMPVVQRRYAIRFLDLAQALWTQHYPLELYVQSSVNDVLRLHAVAGMQLSADWVGLALPHDVLCLGVRGEGGPSFYDFVAWCVRARNGVFSYDCEADAYAITGRKATKADAITLDAADVEDVSMQLAEPRRHTTHVLNPCVGAAVADKEIANADAASGVRRDVMEHAEIAADFDDRVGVETARVRPGEHALAIQLRRFPPRLPAPGDCVTLGNGFSAALYAWDQRYRAFQLDLHARQPDAAGDDALEEPAAVYELDVRVRAELDSDPVARWPPFQAPQYPVVVEGRVVSASGQDADRTWLSLPNEATSAFEYQVHVPLYNKTVVAPFVPNQLTGHFFFPAYKNQRVLVALDFDRASIVGYLDWAENAKLSRDTQGNAIAFGYGADNGTLVTHQYADAKPALRIRRTFGGDLQTIDLREGVIRFEVTDNPVAPAITPKFDVTPQVESAKAQIRGETTSSVTEVSESFASSSGAAQAALDEATASAETAVTRAIGSLRSRIGAAEVQLAAMQADASGAVATIVAAVEKAKASIAAAGADRLKAPLVALEAKLDALVGATRARLDGLTARIASLDAHLSTADLRAQVGAAQSDQQARVTSLDTHVNDGIVAAQAPLTSLQADIRALEARLSAAGSEAQGRAATLGAELAGPWRSLAGEAVRAKAQLDSKLRAATAQVRSEARKLSGELARLPSSRTGTPPVVQLDGQIAALSSGAEADAAQIKTNLGGAYDAVTRDASAGASGAQERSAALGANVATDTSALLQPVRALGDRVSQTLAEMDADAQRAREACMAIVDSLARQGSTGLAAIPPQIDAAEQRLAQAVQTAKEALTAPVQAARSGLEGLAAQVRAVLDDAMAAIDAAGARIRSLVDQADAQLDALRDAALAPLRALVATVNTAVDAAMQGLDGFREVLATLRDSILTPITALSSRFAQLQSAFKTGINTLTGLLQNGHAALDSIPAKGLPEMLVQPALAAIEAAVSAALPAIQAGAQAASEGLASLAQTLQTAVATASQAATTQVNAIVGATSPAIDAVVPPVATQLKDVQAQIQSAATAAAAQIDAATTTAKNAIQEALAQLEAQVASVCSRLDTQMDRAQTKILSGLDTVDANVTAAAAQLASAADAAKAPIAAAIESARRAFDSTLAAVTKQIDATGAELVTQGNAASASAREALASLRARVDRLTPAWQESEEKLRAGNDAVVARARAALVDPEAADAAVRAFSDAAAASIAALRAQIAALV